MDGLKIEIGANIQAAIAQVVKLTAGVNALGAASAGVGNNLSQIPAALKPINPAAFKALGESINRIKTDILLQQLRQVAPAANAVSASMAQVGPSSNRAGQALTDLTRIASDAPFGFIAIQNNIQPMLDSFGRLRKESGSTGAALKSLGTSALGLGGIGIAVAAASFLWMQYGDSIQKALFKGKAATESAKKEAEEYSQSIKGITESIAGEASRVAVLVNALKSETLTRGQRKKAIEELKQISPEYFGQLENEKDLVNNLRGAYLGYIQSLKSQFAAKALGKQLDDLFAKKLVLETQLDTKINTVDDAQLNKQRNRIQAELNKLGPVTIDLTKSDDELTAVEKRFISLTKQKQGLGDIRLFDTTGMAAQLAEINKQIDGLIVRQGSIGNFDSIKEDNSKDKKAKDTLAEQIRLMEALKTSTGLTVKEEEKLLALRIQMIKRDQSKNGYDDAQAERLVQAAITNLLSEQVSKREAIGNSVKLLKRDQAALLKQQIELAERTQFFRGVTDTQLQQEIHELIANAGLEATVPLRLIAENPALLRSNINTMLATQAFELKANVEIKPSLKVDALDKAIEQWGQQLKSALDDTIGGAIESLSEILSGGDVQTVFSRFLGMIGDNLISLGKAAVSIGIGLEAIKNAFKSDPKLAVAAGIAMIAVGAFIKQTLSSHAKKFATGGIVTGPTNAIIGEGGQPEVIFPLRELNKFIGDVKGNGNSNSGVVGQVYVDGDQLRVVLMRSGNRFGNSFT